ncbi:hypothetical protein O181_065778 [Austropuccinia psidii MF-1]|uniref:Uncharacterized protein n=1 Tax=Austropuccinia psidii MF-1 TaxID=1389203 RepID=A0A9Q3EVY6_9BASI|nr:hypothetical protein [Austropuccinia psidii MF-1]
MSSKLTELTEYSPSSPPPSGILSLFSSPSMASSGHFHPTQTYDGYKEVEVLDPTCTEFLAKGKDCFEHYNPRSSKCHYCFIVGGRPIYSRSEVPISRINTEGIVKRIRQIANFTPDADAEGSDELDCEEISNSSHPQYPQNFPTHSCYHSYFHSSHTRPSLNPVVRPSPIQQPRNSPIVTSQKLQPVASTSRRREELPPLPFPAAQVFQGRDRLPIQVTREDPNMASENQDALARLFRRVDRNSREVIMYANDRTIPGTAFEEMTEKSFWYKYELINYFKKAFDHLGIDN